LSVHFLLEEISLAHCYSPFEELFYGLVDALAVVVDLELEQAFVD